MTKKQMKIAHGRVSVSTRRCVLRLREDVTLVLDLPLDFSRVDADAIRDQLLFALPPEGEPDVE